MDGDRFDQFTRSLARNVSRRSMVKGITTLLAGTALTARPLSAKGAPNPCNVYCAGESGPRGAQCRQACKACGGPTSPGFCHDQLNRQYLCCPDGLGCFEPFVEEGVRTAICCATDRQVCQTSNEDFYCCPESEVCMGWSLCCPEGTLSTCEGACCENENGCCFSRAEEQYICGDDCYDLCQGQSDCGERNDSGYCVANTCYDQCVGDYRCGPPDEQGNCSIETCFDVCGQQTICGTPNPRGNCSFYFTCYDPCTDTDLCSYPDSFGNCTDTTCYDPAQGTTICGADCSDICNGEIRCGSSAGNPYGYCDDTICRTSTDGFNCGPADDEGACIE